MGRIFEVRKHTMFARWNRMAKQFSRIGKDITIAVKKGGSDPNSTALVVQALVATGSLAAPAFTDRDGLPIAALLQFQLGVF